MTLGEHTMMFVSNIRAVFLKKLNLFCVLFPCHDTNKHHDTGIVPTLLSTPLVTSDGWMTTLSSVEHTQVFDTLPILELFLLTEHVEVCNFYHRYTSTVRDGI